MNKIKTNTLAKKIKLADLKHNSDITRIESPTQKDILRIEKYKQAINYLTKE